MGWVLVNASIPGLYGTSGELGWVGSVDQTVDSTYLCWLSRLVTTGWAGQVGSTDPTLESSELIFGAGSRLQF